MKYADNNIISNPGDPWHIIYSPKVSKDGNIELVESGKENTDDIIQSFEESTDINYLMTRIAQGDLTALNQRNGIFGDFTGMPKTYAEVLQLHIDANRLFDSLPVEVKQKFDNDENKFFAQAGTDDWKEKLDSILPDELRLEKDVKVVNPGVEE